ncbi:MAG: oligosaccharide flippase family protein [Micropepsaceae bacterium]
MKGVLQHHQLRNILANAVGQFSAIVFSILMVPLYFQLLGAEAYGLLGFAALVQSWVLLLDAGASATLGRTMSRVAAGLASANEARALLRVADRWMLLTGAALLLICILLSGWISTHWLEGKSLSPQAISQVFVLLVTLAVFRLTANMYRSAISAYGQQLLANSVYAASNVLRLTAPIPLLLTSPDIRLLFLTWIVLSLLEMLILRFRIAWLLAAPAETSMGPVPSTQPAIKFAAMLAITSTVWVLATQIDKALLSARLPLEAFGYFSVCLTLSNAVSQLATPITAAYQPSFNALGNQHSVGQFYSQYSRATQIVMIIVAPVSFALFFFPSTSVTVWTGAPAAATYAIDVLPCFVLGSMLSCIAALAYSMQVGFGSVSLHMRSNLIAGALFVPLAATSAIEIGPAGSSAFWLAFNAVFSLLWLPRVIEKFFPGRAEDHFAFDIAPSLIGALIGALLSRIFFGDKTDDRLTGLCILMFSWTVAMVGAVGFSILMSRWRPPVSP